MVRLIFLPFPHIFTEIVTQKDPYEGSSAAQAALMVDTGYRLTPPKDTPQIITTIMQGEKFH